MILIAILNVKFNAISLIQGKVTKHAKNLEDYSNSINIFIFQMKVKYVFSFCLLEAILNTMLSLLYKYLCR